MTIKSEGEKFTGELLNFCKNNSASKSDEMPYFGHNTGSSEVLSDDLDVIAILPEFKPDDTGIYLLASSIDRELLGEYIAYVKIV